VQVSIIALGWGSVNLYKSVYTSPAETRLLFSRREKYRSLTTMEWCWPLSAGREFHSFTAVIYDCHYIQKYQTHQIWQDSSSRRSSLRSVKSSSLYPPTLTPAGAKMSSQIDLNIDEFIDMLHAHTIQNDDRARKVRLSLPFMFLKTKKDEWNGMVQPNIIQNMIVIPYHQIDLCKHNPSMHIHTTKVIS